MFTINFDFTVDLKYSRARERDRDRETERHRESSSLCYATCIVALHQKVKLVKIVQEKYNYNSKTN